MEPRATRVFLLACLSPRSGDRCRYSGRRTDIKLPLTLEARPNFKRTGVCCTFFFFVMGAFSVFVAATNADGSFANPILAACIFGAFWGAFTLLGVYLWRFSNKYRLEITEDAIEQIGVFTQRRISLLQIENAKWRNRPQGGSIKLIGLLDKMSIELGTTGSREWLIEHLRSKIPVDKQTGWDGFVGNNEKPSTQKTLSPFWLGMIFHTFATSFVIAWLMGLGWVYLFVALINSGFATYLMRRKIAG